MKVLAPLGDWCPFSVDLRFSHCFCAGRSSLIYSELKSCSRRRSEMPSRSGPSQSPFTPSTTQSGLVPSSSPDTVDSLRHCDAMCMPDWTRRMTPNHLLRTHFRVGRWSLSSMTRRSPPNSVSRRRRCTTGGAPTAGWIPTPPPRSSGSCASRTRGSSGCWPRPNSRMTRCGRSRRENFGPGAGA